MISEILKNEASAHSARSDADTKAELAKLGYADGERAFKELKALAGGPLGDLIDELSTFALTTPAPEKALTNLNEITSRADKNVLKTLAKAEDKKALKELTEVLGSSPYLSNILMKEVGLLEEFFIEDGLVETNLYEEEIKNPLNLIVEGSGKEGSNTKDEATAARALRRFRNREYLRIGARDLLCYADMATITGELSALARVSLDAAYDFSLRRLKEKHGEPLYIDADGREKEALFSVIALGKLGGKELNFLSDIDILYISSTNSGETKGVEGKARSQIDLHSFFGRLAKDITALIGEVTEDGFVFRVDLDLRPDGQSGQMVNSLASLETYYHSWGRPWERSAMIKAAHAAGAPEVSREFLGLIEPFVYRRSLDFASIEEIKAMKEGIDRAREKSHSGETNVKLGRGGIREIEFFTQALQLIYGGRDNTLRHSSTLKAISLLREAGKLTKEDAELLTESYILLRNLEHRIQMVDGRQTQTLPNAPEELAHVARTLKTLNIGAIKTVAEANSIFWKRYKEVTGKVESIYRSLFYDKEEELADEIPVEVREMLRGDTSPERAADLTKALGLDEGCAGLITAFGKEPTGARLTQKGATILERLRPFIVTKALKTSNPTRAMRGAIRFVSTIGARAGLYALLFENPPFIEEILKIFAESEFLTSLLVERPENLDTLLTRDPSHIRRTDVELSEELDGLLKGSTHLEESLDILRRFKSQELFRIGTGDVTGRIPTEAVALELTTLAEVLLNAALQVSLKEVELKGKRPAGSSFYILGLGGLGARELLYGSDLDIIFVYSDDDPKDPSGDSSGISTHQFYVTLAQKIINTLSARTGAGTVYEVDTRLRPSGSAGPLVVSKESLLEYHKKEAQTWERQAMIKARIVAAKGDAAKPEKDKAEAIIKALQEVVYSKGFTRADAEEMTALRSRMEEEIAKEAEGDINIKVGRGGLADIDFIIQALQLRFGGSNLSLRETETLKALEELRKAGAIDDGDFKVLKEAYLFYRLLEIKLRVVEDIGEGTIKAGSEALSVLARKIGGGQGVAPGAEKENPEDDGGADPEAILTEECERRRRWVRDIYEKTFREKIK